MLKVPEGTETYEMIENHLFASVITPGFGPVRMEVAKVRDPEDPQHEISALGFADEEHNLFFAPFSDLTVVYWPGEWEIVK